MDNSDTSVSTTEDKKSIPPMISRFERKWECPNCGHWNEMKTYVCIFCDIRYSD